MTPSSEALSRPAAIQFKLIRAVALILVVTAGMLAAAFFNNRSRTESVGWITHAHSLVSETEAILSSLNAAESETRAYLLSGEASARQTAETALSKIGEHVAVAQELAFQSADQLQRLHRLNGLAQKQIDWLKEALQSRARGAALLDSVEARANRAAINGIIREAKSDQYSLLEKSERNLQWRTWITDGFLFAGITLNTILLIHAFNIVRKDLKVQQRAAKELREMNESLEQLLRARTGELGATASKLQLEELEHKWGQVALERLAGHHELIVNSLRDSVLVISRNGKIISTNPAAADLAEREARQLPGHSIVEFVVEHKTSGNTPWDRHFLSDSIKNGRPLEPTAAFLKKPNGTALPIRVACYPTHASQKSTGAVITIWPGV